MTGVWFSPSGGSPDFGRIFYEDFEAYSAGTLPESNGWTQDGTRNLPQVVTSATDAGPGPYGGTKMLRINHDGTVLDSNPARFETAVLDISDYTDELFIRIRFRRDANHAQTGGSACKGPRIFYWDGVNVYRDMFATISTGNGLKNEAAWANVGDITNFDTYWGDGIVVPEPQGTVTDNTNDTAAC